MKKILYTLTTLFLINNSFSIDFNQLKSLNHINLSGNNESENFIYILDMPTKNSYIDNFIKNELNELNDVVSVKYIPVKSSKDNLCINLIKGKCVDFKDYYVSKNIDTSQLPIIFFIDGESVIQANKANHENIKQYNQIVLNDIKKQKESEEAELKAKQDQEKLWNDKYESFITLFNKDYKVKMSFSNFFDKFYFYSLYSFNYKEKPKPVNKTIKKIISSASVKQLASNPDAKKLLKEQMENGIPESHIPPIIKENVSDAIDNTNSVEEKLESDIDHFASFYFFKKSMTIAEPNKSQYTQTPLKNDLEKHNLDSSETIVNNVSNAVPNLNTKTSHKQRLIKKEVLKNGNEVSTFAPPKVIKVNFQMPVPKPGAKLKASW